MTDEKTDVFKDPNLLNLIVKAVQSTGVVGESMSIAIETVIICGKLVINKRGYSTNIHPEDESGAGKDFVTAHVKDVVFKDDWIPFDAPSPTTITRGQRKILKSDKEGNETWTTEDHTITQDSIIYIRDASESFLNSQDCKMLLEGDVDISRTDPGTGRTTRFQWKKPVVIITTADTTTDHQIIRRLPSLRMDSSKKQTNQIMESYLDTSCNIINRKTIDIQKIIDGFYSLKKVYVELKEVKDYIIEKGPKCNSIFMRSLYPRFIDYIKFHCALHQKQRKFVMNSIILAEKEDVDAGRKIFEYIYADVFGEISTLNSRQRKIRDIIRADSANDVYHTVNELNLLPISAGVSIQQTYEDLKQIMIADRRVKITDEWPRTYQYIDPDLVTIKEV